MAAGIIFTDPSEHPSFVREWRHIKELLARTLILSGRTEQEAIREAEALLTTSQTDHKLEPRKGRGLRAGG
jgi:hypothetical protein